MGTDNRKPAALCFAYTNLTALKASSKPSEELLLSHSHSQQLSDLSECDVKLLRVVYLLSVSYLQEWELTSGRQLALRLSLVLFLVSFEQIAVLHKRFKQLSHNEETLR